jgi:pyruvate dehydrogenase E2 component (dihydrolipoyllysine-residue acetyltransferase)
MATELFVPKLGQTVEEVTLVQWLVEDGAKVSQGQEVMEVETDKAVFPVEANSKGYIHFGPFKEGQVVPVLTVVAIIGKENETFALAASAPAETADTSTASSSEAATIATDQTAHTQPPEADGQKLFASPRARKLATEKHVDLHQVTPTGWGGERVTERDVLNTLSQMPKVTPLAQRVAAETGVDLHGLTGSGPGGRIRKDDVLHAIPAATPVNVPRPEVVERIPLKGVRAIIAERMAASIHTGARVTLVTEADATEFVAARTRIKQQVEQDWGFAPSYTDLLAKIVAAALRQFPYVNARLGPDAIEILGHVHLGIAVDTERGLLVPVIRDADQLTLRQLGSEAHRLAESARSGRTPPDELSGGTFTITNLGTYEIDAFTPVINLPEAAILGVGRISPKAAAFHGELAIRQMCTLSLAFDHRLMDGAPAARFLQSVKRMVEEPYLLLTV